MKRYDPSYEELQADAKLLLRGFTNKVRCPECNYRVTWASDTEEKDGKPIYQTCMCSKDPVWIDQALENLTYRDITDAWRDLFGDMFPVSDKLYSYIFDRFVEKLQIKQFLKKQYQQEHPENTDLTST